MSTSTVREEGLDKFYTKVDVSRKFVNVVDSLRNLNDWDLIVEPSAGSGSFFNQLPEHNRIGLDISPQNTNITLKDFFTYFPDDVNKRILVIGNPPFGKISSLAVKFFNHASEWCNMIAFIVPRTFRRVSIQNKLNLNFHLIYDEQIPVTPCAFEPKMMAKCCFQIWEKRNVRRSVIKLPLEHHDWKFMGYGPKDSNNQPTPPQNADFAMRAYGGKCGEIKNSDLETLRPKSWHWIKSNINKNELMERFQQLDYSLCEDTSRQNSIGRAEVVKLYSDRF